MKPIAGAGETASSDGPGDPRATDGSAGTAKPAVQPVPC